MLKQLLVLWKFSRPHTIVGSTISIIVLWLMAIQSSLHQDNFDLLLLTLIAGIGTNIFIVGLNQIIDIDLDRINKPNLPLVDGSLTIRGAYQIVFVSLLVTLAFSFFASIILGWLIVIILLIGIAYSVPPVQLKKHHLPAALAITTVRGVLVNLGMFLHFSYASGHLTLAQVMAAPSSFIPFQIWMLTSFVVAFSIAIAWFKDLPDTKGDAKFKFNTLAIVYSPKIALYGGVFLVGIAYIITIFWTITKGETFLTVSHVIVFLAFLVNVWFVDLQKPITITRFYMIFWLFFFLEYIFFGIDALI